MECHTLSFFRGSIGVYKQFTQFEHPQFFVHEPGYKLVALYHGFGIMSNEKGGGFLVPVPYGLGKSDHAFHWFWGLGNPVKIIPKAGLGILTKCPRT